ncbi:MAG: hypothetical protein ACRCT8_07525 [Lacipirellulaceae bacterium]
MNTLALFALPLLAQAEATGPRNAYTISWALVLLATILGLVVALRPVKREITVKRAKD